MPNPLRRKSGSSSLDSKNEEHEEKKRSSPCSNGGKKLSAAKYREILLKNQGREGDEKSDNKKLILDNDLAQVGDGMEIEQNGGHFSESKLINVVQRSGKIGDGRKNLEMSVSMEEGESTVPLEPEEDGGKINVKVCGGGISEDCSKDVQPKDAVLMAETGSNDNVCVIHKLGENTGKLLGSNGKGCTNNYHLECADPPLKDVPPGGWHCVCYVKKNIESGVLFCPGAVESNLDDVQVELADSASVDSTKTSSCNNNDSNGNVEKLKERLVRVVASDSKFVEYWVPVKLSNVQLEQYCGILLSNSALLRSSSKKYVIAEALCNVLSSARKCCDHPYFVNPSLQKVLTDGLSEAEYLNAGVKASGKLQVLDKILSETKKQGLRVLIIFQSNVGSSGISLGDVLDDFVLQRCGVDSYERVDRGFVASDEEFANQKQSAMNKFNDREKGRIVFLLDQRACLPSIKLSSVDMVILYDSDLNPYNDMKVLQKITIVSQHEQLKVFRLYSLYTVEEMFLIHAKQGLADDAQNLNRSTIHQLLRWGASYLFKELAVFHGSSTSSDPKFSSDNLVKELPGQLPANAGSPSPINSSIVVKVNQTGGTYSRDISLPGELEMQSVDEDLPHVFFWTKLLDRKTPEWRYLPAASSPLENRKRVKYFECSLETADFDNDDVTKKKRKGFTGITDAPVVEDTREVGGLNKEGKRINDTNEQDQVGLVPWEFPSQPAITDNHFELPTYNDALQDTMLQQSVLIDRCVGGTRVTDFRSLGVVPDCISHHPLHIAQLTYARTSQTLLQGDPLLNELVRIRQEGEKAVKFHEESRTRIRFDYHKEVQEVYKKYSKLHYDNDTALARTKNAIDTNHNKVTINVMLAKYLRDNCL
ncbi:helicase protein MOM1-like [Papaver somniferum]|uniref:helicase protein MOM1-like n=1 Tax=Papaver somniferum TaxID=3469 RepID=UPI000E70347F|nr:helicase protein MOM1-like [Papaver somniferum]XP_026382179.1 helicase protein MOM1-like [Papaver somniferum]